MTLMINAFLRQLRLFIFTIAKSLLIAHLHAIQGLTPLRRVPEQFSSCAAGMIRGRVQSNSGLLGFVLLLGNLSFPFLHMMHI